MTMELQDVKAEHAGGIVAFLAGLVFWGRKWLRSEKVSDSNASVSVAVNAAVQTLLDNQTKRLDEMDSHISRIERELSVSRQAHRDCEHRYQLASEEIKELRAKVDALMMLNGEGLAP